MAWHESPTDKITRHLRFGVRAALTIDGIILAAASIYLTSKLVRFGIDYLNRKMFAHPW